MSAVWERVVTILAFIALFKQGRISAAGYRTENIFKPKILSLPFTCYIKNSVILCLKLSRP